MSGTSFGTDPAGWYGDPADPGQQRYWSGTGWTVWVWDGSDVTPSPLPHDGFPAPHSDCAHLRYVRDVFLPRAAQDHVVAPTALTALADYALELELGAVRRQPARAGAAASARPAAAMPPTSPPSAARPPSTTLPPVPRAPVAARAPASAPLLPFEPKPYRPGPVARWWDRTRDAIGSDLAAHGLAYLGVLLLFVGVFGLVAFAFGDVAETMRPVAELGIAVAPFLASWMLLRRGALIAGRALETAGGLLLPIMLVTSFLDGVPAPPDLTGTVLVLTLTAVTAGVSGAYALWSARHHESTLRYLVAPVAWLAVAIATMGIGRDIPSGRGVATITAAQVAAVAVAVLVSLLCAWVRPGALLAGPTFTSTVPALVVLAPIAVVTWAVGDWLQLPIAVTGVAGLLVLELMIGHLRREVVTTIQPLWWAVVGLALVPSLGVAPAAVCAAAGFLALLELESSDGASTRTMVLSASGLGLSLLGVWSEPWWAFATMVALTAWAHARRLHPYHGPAAPLALDLAAALFPMGAVVALAMATRHVPAAVLVGAVLALLAAWPATRRGDHPVLRRDAHDHFWVLWWDAAMVVSVIALAMMTGPAWPSVVTAQWMLVAALAVLAVSAAVGPLPASLRAWLVLPLVTWCWLLGGHLLDVPTAALGVTMGAVALVVVAVTHLRPRWLVDRHDAASSAWAGIALGVAGVVVTADGPGWGLATTVALSTAAWILITAFDAVGRSPAVDVLVAAVAPEARRLPAIVSVVGLPATTLLVLDAAGLVTVTSPWAPVVLALTAVGYAAAARLRVGELVASTLGWAACTAAIVAPALCTQELPALVALLALVVAVVVLPAARRPAAMVWFAWATAAPIVALGLAQGTTVYDGHPVALALAATLAAVGAVLLLGGMALDLRGRAWGPVWRPSSPAYLPVVVLGAAEVVTGFAVATVVLAPTTAGWLTAFVATVLVVAAVLTRAWSLVGAAAALGWMSLLQLRGDDVLAAPWFSLTVTVCLLVAAEVAHRVITDARMWVRCEWLLLVVAHLTAATALLGAGSETSFSLTYVAVGTLAIAGALRLHRDVAVAAAYGILGTGLALVGAAAAGPGWLALALALTSLACSVLATRAAGTVRWSLLATGAVSALTSWLSVAAWLEWTQGQVVDRTVLLGAAISLLCAGLLRWTGVDRTVVFVRAGLAVLTATLTPPFASVVGGSEVAVTTSTCASLAALVLAAVLAARPLAQAWVRYVAVVYLLASVAELFSLLDATPAQQLSALAALTVACAIALVSPWLQDAWRTWRAPVMWLGSSTSVLALGVALLQLPDSLLLTPALLVAAVMSAALAAEMRSLVAQVCSPVLVCAAWLVYAARALDGNPQWFLVPVGLTLLVVVGLLRHRLHLTGGDPAAAEVVVLELAGIAFLVGPSFVQAFTDSLAYAALAAALGLLVAGWGVLTRVRRRVTAGIAVTFAALLVLVGVPLAQLLPAWTNVTLWVTIACLGLLAIVGATLLEKGRAVVRAGLDSFRSMTEGWE